MFYKYMFYVKHTYGLALSKTILKRKTINTMEMEFIK